MDFTVVRHRSAAARLGIMVLLASALLAVPTFQAAAEGRCPPGQYPVGGQGVGGCAPTGGGASGSSDPVPTGRWHQTWGAVAFSNSGDAGAVAGKLTKSEAVAAAIDKCAQWGASDCQADFTFKNQCAAVIQADKALGTRLNTGATKEIALQRATESCKKAGSKVCAEVYAECSMPYFEKY
ncbi:MULTISPECIES: DUF4189 domain-containing protein [Stenotrophomonas]|uniref:DUF4189 domain-containing protein n=1 Tax=Stenotrophomonas TaxID=40323 RepID=UPI0031B62ACE